MLVRVSILVILEIQSDRETLNELMLFEVEFQSLLSWKYNQIKPLDGDSFRKKILFQSLLSWKYNQIVNFIRRKELIFLSFNPCYLGNTIRSLFKFSRLRTQSTFQSLLSWKYNQISSLLVSVFCLVYCFNPCYLGNTIRSQESPNGNINDKLVSILVILEIQSDQELLSVAWPDNTVSILVILEIQSDLDPDDMKDGLLFSFNPCYLGNTIRSIIIKFLNIRMI